LVVRLYQPTSGKQVNGKQGTALRSDICQAGRDHWESLKHGREAPLRSDFDPIEIPSLLPYVLLIEVVDGGRDFKYTVIGGHIRQYFLGNWTGSLISTLPHVDPDGQLMTNLKTVTETRRPIDTPVDYVGPMKDIRKNDEIILPLLDTDGTVSHLLIFIEFVKVRP